MERTTDHRATPAAAWERFKNRLEELRAEQRAAVRAFGERLRLRGIADTRKLIGLDPKER